MSDEDKRSFYGWFKHTLFKCKLCDKTSRSFQTMKEHFKCIHAIMTTHLRAYYDSYVIGDGKKDEELKQENCDEKKMFTKWLDGFGYSCLICHRTFQNTSRLKAHLFNKHGVKYSEYCPVYKPVRQKHTCQLCEEKITHTVPCIRQHLKKAHEKDIKDYFNAYILPDMKIRKLSNLTKQEMVNVLEEDIADPILTNFSAWSEQCKLKCKVCNERFGKTSLLLKHLQDKHKLSKSRYFREFNTFWDPDDIQYQTCKLCNKAFSITIMAHVSHHHKIAPISYFRSHVMKTTFTLKELGNLVS